MPRFRVQPREARRCDAAGEPTLDDVRRVIAGTMQPQHFFVGKPLGLEWQYSPSEDLAWEIYQGRLLDAAHTRLRQTFETWSVFCVAAGNGAKGTDSFPPRSTEPILSLKFDAGCRQLHVMRAIHCYAWEGYHAGDNIYLSRETRKWIPELVGSICVERFLRLDDLRDEIICLLFQAVAGCSRLPLQSVEAPMPAFSLGWLGYFNRAKIEPERGTGTVSFSAGPMQSFCDLIEDGLHGELAWLEKTKLLELLLRSTAVEDLGAAVELFMSRWRGLAHSSDAFIALCRTLFNEVALSPYTDFVDKMLVFLKTAENRSYLSAEVYADLLSYMLRQNARHLTAYDLITFHHRGANYPDALLLDAVLREYLVLIENRPDFFISTKEEDPGRQRKMRIRRRALRQSWLLRHTYEGLPVPDAPTSPGENSRVLPPPYEHVPEEQITEPGKRTKRLFAGEPLVFPGERSCEVLRLCMADLQHPEELQELGMAVFLDRPFGLFKAPMEPDRTLLLSYETFSRSVAQRRLERLVKDQTANLSTEVLESYRCNLLNSLSVQGIPITPGRKTQRPGAVALHDAARVADDFVALRSTRQTVQAFLEQFDFTALAERCSLDYFDAHQCLLIVSAASTRSGLEGVLDVYDERLRRRLELQIDASLGYRARAGQEYPVPGLRVLYAWQADGKRCDLGKGDIILPARE